MSWSNPQRDEEDRKVLSRCRQGDTESFARIIEAYKTPLYHLIFKWVGHKEGSEELLQDVFLKAFRQLKNFRGESKFSTWLFQIAINRCRDYFRSPRTRREEELNPDLPLADPKPREDEMLNTQEEVSQLRRGLEALPPIYREALSLRYLSEMSHEEIAQRLGEKLSNVKMRVARGLMKLRKKLEERGNG